jgi:hypothetical protein
VHFKEARTPLSLSSIFLSFLAQFNLGLTASSCHVFKLPTLIVNILIATWRSSMKRLLILAALALMLGGEVKAGMILRFDFTGKAGNETSLSATDVNALVLAGDLTRGSGLTASAAGDSFSASGWTTSNSIDANDYFQFTVTSNANTTMSLDRLSFAERRSGTGTRNFELRSSTNGFTTSSSQAVFGFPDDTNTRQRSIVLTGLSNLSGGTSVTFRVYGYSAEASAGTWRLQNNTTDNGLFLDGSITAVPEPTSGLLIGIGTLACFALRRNRRSA